MTCVYCHEKEPVKEGLCIECFDYLEMQLEEYSKYREELEEAASSLLNEEWSYSPPPYVEDLDDDIPF